MSVFNRINGPAVLLCCAVFAAPAMAQSSDPAWLDDLSMQLRSEKECEPNMYINMNEGVLGANNYYEARVQCMDGRMFDASKTEPEKEFTIKACEIVMC